MIRAINLFLLLTLAIGFVCGCDSRPLPNLQYLPNREQPIPVAHLPIDYRLKNWIGTNDRGSRGGSCFWASVYMCVRHADRPDIEELLIQHRGDGFEGPEHLTSMCRKLDSIGIPWAATEDGDVELLERASEQRRWAAIGYYPGHAICFCGFYETGQGEIAILLDNNFPDDYIGVPKSLFVDSWKHAYGGMGVVPWLEPAIVNSYPRTRMLSHAEPKTVCPGIDHGINADRSLPCADSITIDQGISWLGQHSIGTCMVATKCGCVRTRHGTSARHSHWPEVHADSSQQCSASSAGRCNASPGLLASTGGNSTAGLSTVLAADRCIASGLCSFRPVVSELPELQTEPVLLTRLSIRRGPVRQHRGPELRISADQQQFAVVA
jgi:hypothetical protein